MSAPILKYINNIVHCIPSTLTLEMISFTILKFCSKMLLYLFELGWIHEVEQCLILDQTNLTKCTSFWSVFFFNGPWSDKLSNHWILGYPSQAGMSYTPHNEVIQADKA